MNEFSLGDQEGYLKLSCPVGNGAEEVLKAGDVGPVRCRGHCEGEIVHIGEHKASRDD